MGVQTTADEKRDDAWKSVRQAISSLVDIIYGECWGHDEWNTDYRMKLRSCLHRLEEIRDDLKSP